MPGILGISGPAPKDPKTTAELLRRMADPIRYRPDQPVELFINEKYAAATVGYGKDFRSIKPAAAEKNGVLLLIDGEIFPETGNVPAELLDAEPSIQRADYALYLYMEHGPSFVSMLNGTFTIAVLDSRDGKTHLYTDRFRSRSMCVRHDNKTLVFATSVRSILNFSPEAGKQYDRLALSELFVFEYIRGDKTLFEDIKRLDPASHAVWDGRTLTSEKYFTPRVQHIQKHITSPRDGARELYLAFKRSAEKRFSGSAKTTVLLSGGIDSRLALSLCPKSVTAATYCNKGNPFTKEVRIARTVAKTFGVEHLLLERDSDYYAKIAALSVEANDAFATYISGHSAGVHDQLREKGIEVVLTGMFLNAALKAYFPLPEFCFDAYPNGPKEVNTRTVSRIVSYEPVFRRAERQDLLTLALNNEMKDTAALAREHAIRDIMSWFSQDAPLAELFDSFPLQDMRTASNDMSHTRGLQTTFVDRSPFLDNEVFDLSFALPASWKTRGDLIRRCLWLSDPKLALITDSSTGLPAGIVPPYDLVFIKTGELARKLGRALSERSRLIRSLRGPKEGERVFTEGQFHDMNALLRTNIFYRELVEASIEQLPDGFFDIGMIKKLYLEDLNSSLPRLRVLFEIIITFALFDKKWGPRARMSE